MVARWPSEAREPYVVYAPQSRAVEARIETLQVSWYASAGTFEVDARTTQTGEEVRNTYTTPAESSPVWVWVVLRDDRGGISMKTNTFEVR
jgi:hypothetical protein